MNQATVDRPSPFSTPERNQYRSRSSIEQGARAKGRMHERRITHPAESSVAGQRHFEQGIDQAGSALYGHKAVGRVQAAGRVGSKRRFEATGKRPVRLRLAIENDSRSDSHAVVSLHPAGATSLHTHGSLLTRRTVLSHACGRRRPCGLGAEGRSQDV